MWHLQRGWETGYELLGACEDEWWGDGVRGGCPAPRDAFERYWRLSKRRLWVWGMGEHGQLGLLDGARREVRSSAIGLEVRALRGLAVVGVSCGAAHSVCLLASGRVLSWGCGKYGRLGHGSEANESQPREVAALGGVRCVRVACGGSHNLAVVLESRGCAVVSALYVWGSDMYGECGLEAAAVRVCDACPEGLQGGAEPVRANHEGGGWISRAGGGGVGGGGHGVRKGGGLRYHLVPQHNSGVPAHMIAQLECGSAHSLVLLTTGMVLAFGRGEYGQQVRPCACHVRCQRCIRP